MAITIKTLKGSNSLSADRITINDNFKINTDAINGILGVVNTTSGLIDNTNVGTNNTIKTEGITLTESGVEVQKGDVNILEGNISMPTDGASIGLGADNSKIADVVLGASGPNNIHSLEFQNYVAIEVPKMNNDTLTNLDLGATGPNLITFDTGTSQFKGWNGTEWVVLDATP